MSVLKKFGLTTTTKNARVLKETHHRDCGENWAQQFPENSELKG